MMNLVKFNDFCTISRKNGIDKYDNEIETLIYKGHCLYQEDNVMTSQGVVVRRAMIYIPHTVQAQINDQVHIGDVFALVEHSNIIELPLTGNIVTKLDLKRAIG